MNIDICICTYRRESIRDAIMSIDGQILTDDFHLRVIVVDNDATPSAQPLVDEAASIVSIPVQYVHAPKNNISLARNAALDATTADWVAFMDDDEVASPQWISTLYKYARDNQLDVVFGPAIARYGKDTPGWILKYDYLSSYPESRDGEYQTGPTNNVIMNMKAPSLQGRRFDLGKGKTGGEDTNFFFGVWHAGGKLGMCDQAIVYEDAAPERLNFKWLRVRKFRSGMTYARAAIKPLETAKKAAFFVAAASKTGFCLICAFGSIWSEPKRNFWVLRFYFHLGVISAYLRSEPEMY